MEADDREKAAALEAKKQMKAAVLIITGSIVFVFVAIALVVLIGHIRIF